MIRCRGKAGGRQRALEEKILFSFGGRAGRVTAPIFPESSRRRKRGLLRGSIGENGDTTGSYYLETHCLGDLRQGGIFIDRQTMIHDNTGHEC